MFYFLENMKDNELQQRAKKVVGVVVMSTSIFLKQLMSDEITKTEPLSDLKKLSQNDFKIITSLVYVYFLFEAQRFFWEKIITEKDLALRFEKKVFDCFEENVGYNPKEYIVDIGEYIKKQGSSESEVRYLGSKICRELGKESAFLMVTINTIASSILTNGFFESLRNAWKLKI